MFSDPNVIVPQLNVLPGSSVADLGAGTGAYSFLLAQIVGPTGKVYACEVQKDIMLRLESDIKDRGIRNIQTVWSNIETHQGTKLRDQTMDWIIIANVLFQIEERDAFIAEVARILKPDGSVLLVDWVESFGNLGPHPKEVIQKDAAVSLFASHGLQPIPRVIDAGSHHYGIVFKKHV